MIGLTSSSQVAITIITNFPCLLMFSFQYTAFFFNIFDTSAYINLFLSVHCQFLISNCFLKKYVSGYHTFYYVLSQGLVCTLYDGGKLENCQKLLENSWNLSGKNEWPPCNSESSNTLHNDLTEEGGTCVNSDQHKYTNKSIDNQAVVHCLIVKI